MTSSPADPGSRGRRRVPRRDAGRSAELDEEIASHVDLRVEELIAAGWSEPDARAEAERRFGAESTRRQLHEAARRKERVLGAREWLERRWQDGRYAWRQLRRSPGYSLAAILTFALGIGAHATMFGLVDRLLLRAPAGIVAPEDVYGLDTRAHDGPSEYTRTSMSYPSFQDLERSATNFAALAAQTYPQAIALGRGAQARSVKGLLVSGGYFPMLGVRAALGRLLGPGDDVPTAAGNVVVLSHRLWRNEYGEDPGVLGRRIQLGTGWFTIVGVPQNGFTGVDLEPADVFVPLNAADAPRFPLDTWRTMRRMQLLRVRGRLRAGVAPAAAAAQATAIYRAGEAAGGQSAERDRLQLDPIIPARSANIPAASRVAFVLGVVSLLVLLMACVNVANLLLTRILRRRPEITLRMALGITRGRLFTQLLSESLLLAVLGGAAALLLVATGGRLLQHLLLDDYAWPQSPVDAHVFLFTALVTLLVGVSTSLLPALRAAPADLAHELRSGMRAASPTRTRQVLLVLQATAAVVLLTGTGIFVRSFVNGSRLRTGMDADRLLLVSTDLGAAGFSDAQANDVLRTMLEELSRMPGIEHAALVEGMPYRSYLSTTVALPGRDTIPELHNAEVRMMAVSSEYFETAGTRLLRGRAFASQDGRNTAIVNDVLARVLWPDADPIGQCIDIGMTHLGEKGLHCSTVVGVAESTRSPRLGDDAPGPQLYVPEQAGRGISGLRALLVRPAGDAFASVRVIHERLQSVAPELPLVDVVPMSTLLAGDTRPARLGAVLFGLFAALAILLSAVGLFGVMSCVVGERLHELSIRVALGARQGRILGSVLGRAPFITAQPVCSSASCSSASRATSCNLSSSTLLPAILSCSLSPQLPCWSWR